jgi:hypothetical protein
MPHLLPLPDSRCAHTKNVIRVGALNWVPIFCANCGADGGIVPEESITFVFYLCDPCAQRNGQIDGMYMEPDAIFFEKVRQAQIEKYGRELTAGELVVELEDESSIMSKLAKDGPKPA